MLCKYFFCCFFASVVLFLFSGLAWKFIVNQVALFSPISVLSLFYLVQRMEWRTKVNYYINSMVYIQVLCFCLQTGNNTCVFSLTVFDYIIRTYIYSHSVWILLMMLYFACKHFSACTIHIFTICSHLYFTKSCWMEWKRTTID